MFGIAYGRCSTGCSLGSQGAPAGGPVNRKNFVRLVNFGMVVYSSNDIKAMYQNLMA